MKELLEGLKEGDLENLVLPLISIDEYESKLDKDAIVVAFFVQDYEPAKDLNRFIQKGDVNLLDTDVSPAPNEDGYFLVFVELMRNTSVPDKILHIIDTINNLVSNNTWQFCTYGHDNEVFPCDKRHLDIMIRTKPVEHEIEDMNTHLQEFFRPSILDNMTYIEPKLILERFGAKMELFVKDFSSIDQLYKRYDFLRSDIRLDEAAQLNARRLRSFLGAHWLVEQIADFIVLTYEGSMDGVLLHF